VDDLEREAYAFVTKSAGPESLEWMDAADMARALGVALCTMQRWLRRGVIRGRRMGAPGSKWRVRMLDWAAAQFRAASGDRRTFRLLAGVRVDW
jgi:hypothetical protein